MFIFQVMLIAGFALLCGYYLGCLQKTLPLKKLIQRRARANFLGNLIAGKEERKAAAGVYFDRETAAQEIIHYVWDVQVSPVPFLGYAPTPCKKENVQINSMHFRANNEVTTPKPDRTCRIFLTGGSTMFGVGASDQNHTIGGYLEGFIRTRLAEVSNMKLELFTAACPAWASSHERILVENVISELQPDIVISFSGFNDVHWAWNQKNVMWFRSYADNHFWEMLKTAYTIAGYPFLEDSIIDPPQVPEPEIVAQRLKRNIKLISYVLASVSAKFIFILQPHMPVTKKILTEREKKRFSLWHPEQIQYYRHCYHRFRDELSILNVPNAEYNFYDLSSSFDSHSDQDEIFLDGAHFGDKGNHIIATLMFKHIEAMLEKYVSP